MKNLFCLMAAVFIFCTVAHAEMRDMQSIFAKATDEEKKDLPKLLKQITLAPIQDKKTGKTILKVTKLEKGSLWDREGLKIGDLISP